MTVTSFKGKSLTEATKFYENQAVKGGMEVYMNNTSFYICEHCGNIVEKVQDAGVPVVCCGQKMKKLEPGTVEASHEKHVPVVTVTGNLVSVNVGSVDHPMVAEHSILWVALESDKGVQRKHLSVGGAPSVTFALADEKPLRVYAYCNLHGLWQADIVEEPQECPLEELPKNTMENYTVCGCNSVTYHDIEKALHENEQLSDVLEAFEAVKDTTHCSTGCGGCHDKVMAIISELLAGSGNA